MASIEKLSQQIIQGARNVETDEEEEEKITKQQSKNKTKKRTFEEELEELEKFAEKTNPAKKKKQQDEREIIIADGENITHSVISQTSSHQQRKKNNSTQEKEREKNNEGQFFTTPSGARIHVINVTAQGGRQAQVPEEQSQQNIQTGTHSSAPAPPAPQAIDPILLKIQEAVNIMGHPDMRAILGSKAPTLGMEAPNDPFLWMHNGKIKKCYGCKKPIEKEEMTFPRNFVFQLKARVNFMHNGREVTSCNQVYFHPAMRCLGMFNRGIEQRNIRITDGLLIQLRDEQMDWLHGKGFLIYAIKNKLNTV
jgi:hypothetical protein